MLGAAAAISNHDGIVTAEGLSRVATGSRSRRWRRRWALRGKGGIAASFVIGGLPYHHIMCYLGVLLAASRYFDLARLKCVFGVHTIMVQCSRAGLLMIHVVFQVISGKNNTEYTKYESKLKRSNWESTQCCFVGVMSMSCGR